MWTFIALLGLALTCTQVAAQPTKQEYEPVDFIENVIDPGTRILSGWAAAPGQYPHQVSLRMVDAAGTVSSCGGSIVARRWVLTAAHCTALRVSVVVLAGATSITTPQVTLESTEWFNHPTYNNELPPDVVQPNDISILKLPSPLTYTGLLKPIRLQSRADAHRDYDQLTVQTSGFGRIWTHGAMSEVLRWTYLTAVSNSACSSTFGSLITDTTICATYFNVTSQSPCQGDSGGPLVHVSDDGTPTLIGVTSFVAGGYFGCHSGLPIGFIRTGPFHDWLTEVTGIDFEAKELEPEPEPESKESEEDTSSTEEDTSSSEEDPELCNLLKRLQVIVNVKVKINKVKSKH